MLKGEASDRAANWEREEQREREEKQGRIAAGEEYSPFVPPPPLPGADLTGETFLARGGDGGPDYVNRHVHVDDPPWLRLAYLNLTRWSLTRFLESLPLSIWTIAESNALAYLRSTESRQSEADPSSESAFGRLFSTRIGLRRPSDLFPQEPLGIVEAWGVYQHMAVSVAWCFGRGPRAETPLGYSSTLAAVVGELYWATNAPRLELRYDPRKSAAPSELVPFPLLRARRHFTGRALWEVAPHVPASVGIIAAGMFEIIGEAGTHADVCPNCARVFYMEDLRRVTCSTACRKERSRKKRAQETRPQTEQV